MASNVQDSPVVQQTFVEEIDYNEIRELTVISDDNHLLIQCTYYIFVLEYVLNGSIIVNR